MSFSKLLKVNSLCTNCRHIKFFPMKTMTRSRWREYFPFLQNRPDLHELYEERYQSFIRQVEDEYEYEAILHPDLESFAKVSESGACSFCQLLAQMLEGCYVGLPSEPGSKSYEGITIYPPPIEWPEDDLRDLRQSTPRIWIELSLRPFDTTKTGLHEALTDAFLEVKLANTLIYPRFLLSDVHTPGKLSKPLLKVPKALQLGDRHRNPDTGSRSSFKLAQRWLETCRSKHKQCALQDRSGVDAVLPSRLLDLEAKGLGEDLQLFQTQGRIFQVEKGTGISYVSLSHRWGEHQPLQTTSQNFSQHLDRIAYSSLPKTFQDAVQFTKELKVRYLWIDSLCIVQDLDYDKEREIPKMADIYSNAIFNIAACSASDCSDGLYSPRDVNMLKPQHIAFEITTAKGQTESIKATCSPVLRKFAHQPEAITNTLEGRGWIYQERALSKRVFSFEKQLLYFECAEMIASENLPNGAPRKAQLEPLPNRDKWENLLPTVRNRQLSEFGDRLFRASQAGKQSGAPYKEHVDALYRHWYSGIPHYLSRSFKFETDRLIGISGLASRIQAVTGDTYLAGLWRNRLLEGLCWAVTGQDGKSKRYNKHPRAPTWSWASMKGPTSIIYPQNDHFAPIPEIEILDAWTKPNGPNPFGDAPEGELRVKGRIKRAQAWSVATPSGGLERSFGVASLFDPDIDLKHNTQNLYRVGGVAHIYMDRLKFYTFQPFEVWILPIASFWPVVRGQKMGKKMCAMVLRKVRLDNTFIREGWLWRLSRGDDSDWNSEDEDGEGSWFANGCEEMELKII